MATVRAAWLYYWPLLCFSLSIRVCAGLVEQQSAGGPAPVPPSKTTYRGCVVVGDGPVGLAAALTSSNPPHYFDVTVLEKTTDEEFVGMCDPGKAYLCNVKTRGLQWVTHCYPSVLENLLDRGYSPKGGVASILRVPADPQEPIFPIKDVSNAGDVKFDPAARSVWVPRHAMGDLMMETCAEQEKERQEILQEKDEKER